MPETEVAPGAPAATPRAPSLARGLARWRALSPVVRRGLLLFALGVAAATFNAIFGWFEPPHGYYDLKGAPWSDALSYHLDALDFVRGYGLREAFFPVTLRAVRAPGYIVYLAVLYTVAGAQAGPWVARVLAVLAYAGVAVVSYRLAARAFGERIGLLCGAAVALARTAMDFTQYLMTEVPSLALTAAALLLVVRERERPDGADRRWLGAALAGLALGIATTMRTITGIVLPLALGYVLWRRLRSGPARRAALACAIGFALPVGALAARNLHAMGAPTLAATAHTWTAWAEYATPRPDADDARYAQAFYPRVHEPEAEMQRDFRAGFRDWVEEHPLAYARRVYFLALSNLRMPPFGQAMDLASVLAAPLVLLAFAGAARARRRGPVLLVAAAALGTIVANAAFGNSSGRFRVPIDFALTIVVGGGALAGLGVGRDEPQVAQAASPRAWSRPARLAAAGAVLAVAVALGLTLLFAALAGRRSRSTTTPPLDAAQVARIAGDPRLAAAFEALGGTPTYGTVRDALAAHDGDARDIDGELVAWQGELDPLVHLAPGESDARSPLLAARPYGREIGTFLVYGDHGGRDGQHVWIETADGVPGAGARGEALVLGRIAIEPRSPVYERMRVRALAILPL